MRKIVHFVAMQLLLLTSLSRLCLAGPSLVTPNQPAAGVTTTYTLASGLYAGRQYVLHRPTNFGAGSPAIPLIIASHGSGGKTGTFEPVSAFNYAADKYNFLVAYSVSATSAGNWILTPSGDNGYVMAVLADVESRYPVNVNKLAVAGYSYGAVLSQLVVACNPGVFTNLGMVAEGWFPLVMSQCPTGPTTNPVGPMQVVIFHGEADTYTPYSCAGTATECDDAAGNVIFDQNTTGEQWATQIGCNGSISSINVANPNPDYLNTTPTTPITDVVYFPSVSCPGGAQMLRYAIPGAGHTWPGSGTPATATAQFGPLGYTSLDLKATVIMLANFGFAQ